MDLGELVRIEPVSSQTHATRSYKVKMRLLVLVTS